VSGEPAPPVAKLLVPLAGYLTPVGILALVFDAAPTWLGIALIVAGAVLSHQLSRARSQARAGAAAAAPSRP
jgi:hypothetical protein